MRRVEPADHVGEIGMTTQINYVLKVVDAKLAAIKKALTAADIEVVSLVEVYKEESGSVPEEDETAPPAGT